MTTNVLRLITLLTLLVVCSIKNPIQAQNDKIYTKEDVKKGIVKAPFLKKSGDMEQVIKKYLDDNYSAPYSASPKDSWIIRCVVEKDGTLSNFDFEENNPLSHGAVSVDMSVKREISRVLNTMPKMTPAKRNGKFVRYQAVLGVVLTDKLKVYDFSAENPHPHGGIDAMFKWIYKNLQYPPEAHKKNIQGRFTVVFIVEKDGSLSDPKVLQKENSSYFEAEIQRLIKMMPKWIPGKNDEGEAVRVRFSIPIAFRLT